MEEMKKIPTRDQIAMEDKWATEDMYPSDEAWEAEAATLAADQEELVTYAGHMADSAEKLLAYLTKMEQVNAKIELLANYCMRKADEDTRNPVYQAELKKALSKRKERKRQFRKNWFKDNWIALLSLLFSFIAAAPVIIQGFLTILRLLRLSS